MKLKVRNGTFAFRFWPTLITLLLLAILLGLGTWQVKRLHWKLALIATIGERMQEAPLPLAEIGQDPDYRKAEASGTFLYDHELYAYAVAQGSGEGGYHVLTPLKLDDGRLLLVDRGWIPYAKKAGDFPRPAGKVYVTGILRVPEKAGWIQPANDPVKSNWYTLDLPAMAAATQLSGFIPYVLEEDAHPDGGLPLGGQVRLTLPNDHLSYAITWYGLAVIMLIIYAMSSYRKNSGD